MTAIDALSPLPRLPSAPDQLDMRAMERLEPSPILPAEVMEQSEGGQGAADTQKACADLALLHSLMGHSARQLLDLQKVRIAMGNRAAAMERDQLPAHHQATVLANITELEKAEHAVLLQLRRLARQHPMREWVDHAPGIGLDGFGRLMGIIGSLDRFANVAKLWAYLGLHVVDGGAAKRRKGEKANWSAAGRVLMHQIGESIVKVNRGPYRARYDSAKLKYETTHPDWTPMHRHMAAMREAEKELLKDMWLEWRRQSPSVTQGISALPLAA